MSIYFISVLELGDQPISAFKDIKMTGNCTWAGNTSMEITMNLEQVHNSTFGQK